MSEFLEKFKKTPPKTPRKTSVPKRNIKLVEFITSEQFWEKAKNKKGHLRQILLRSKPVEEGLQRETMVDQIVNIVNEILREGPKKKPEGSAKTEAK